MSATPGPWTIERVDYSKKQDVSFEVKAGRDVVAQTFMREIATEGDRIAIDEANVRLIAAAPDLYDAMTGAMQYLDETLGPCESDCECLLHSFHAVIAKAEGRS